MDDLTLGADHPLQFAMASERWEDITVACWQKYPNPMSTHVLSVDTLSREIDPVTRCMRSTRLMQKDNKKPKWMDPWLPNTTVFIVEESLLDPKAKTYTTFTKNITLAPYMMIEEKCVYSVSSENKDWTDCTTEARVTSELMISPLVESFGIGRFAKNSVKAKDALQYVLGKLRNIGGLFSSTDRRHGPAATAATEAGEGAPSEPLL